VVTAKARSRIKQALNEDKRRIAEDGKELLERKLKHQKLNLDQTVINNLINHFTVPSQLDLFYSIGEGIINVDNIAKIAKGENKSSWYKLLKNRFNREKSEDAHSGSIENIIKSFNAKDDSLVIGEDMQKIDYKLATCCNPIPGDEVFGFITVTEGIKIHKTDCPNAVSLMSNFSYRIVKARWTSSAQIAFLAGIRVNGIDDVGIVNNITRIISNELNVNMRSISFDSNDGVFEGNIMVFVHDTTHLTDLISKIKKV
jgi:GTP pyrophosphokinase